MTNLIISSFQMTNLIISSLQLVKFLLPIMRKSVAAVSQGFYHCIDYKCGKFSVEQAYL
jgi:hypothetical protein